MRLSKKRIFALFLSLFSLLPSNHTFSQDTVSKRKEKAVEFNVSYKGDFFGNFVGGQKQGGTYLGFAQIGIGIDCEKAHWWRGGYFYISGGNTHGGTPTRTFVGDFQGVDNIEAGNHTFLEQFWFSQTFKHVTFSFGLQDFNADYAACDHASNFLNSSLGLHSTISSNIPVPTFPINGLAFNFKWNINDQMLWQTGIYDSPLDFDENPYNVNWKLSSAKGYILATEYEYNPLFHNNLESSFKIGAFYQTAEKIWALHFCIEQMAWHKNNSDITLFLMASLADKKRCENYLFASTGIECHGVFSKKGKDMLGLAATCAMFNSDKKAETTFELTYRYQLLDFLYLQPNIQYIINPAGTDAELDNALTAFLRFGIEF